MFILRTILDIGTQHNQVLGNSYHYIHYQDCPAEFKKVYKDMFDKEPSDDIHAFIHAGNQFIPLYRNNWYYVMGSDGETFSNVSGRKR